jgi:hypothetical protein
MCRNYIQRIPYAGLGILSGGELHGEMERMMLPLGAAK